MSGEEIIGTTEQPEKRAYRKRTPVGEATDIAQGKDGAKRRRKFSELDRDVMGFRGERDPAFVYRIINDSGTRVSDMLERGYEIVQDAGNNTLGGEEAGKAHSLGSQVRRVVNRSNGTEGVLMRIRKDYYAEDQADKQKIVEHSEKGLLPKDLTDHYGGRDESGQQIGIRIGN